MLLQTLREQWARVQRLDREIAIIELWLKQALSKSTACKAIAEIPGIDLLSATAAVATLDDPGSFRSGHRPSLRTERLERAGVTGKKTRNHIETTVVDGLQGAQASTE